ncbi:MAG TPA: protein kinase [Vicinamibacterales bacterium]|nr:protein kinase [Vicinamibacterales bacterium]
MAKVAPGTRVGPYEILAPIGAGGMGAVYRARDTRLDRDVAVKVLPPDAALDPDRLRRFEQEARATAALNHPNILIVFDVGAENGISFVVSELLEGETLRDRLRTGLVPLRKAIDYAAQVARGLAAAHGKGIVHRDLKPENLFVTRDGRVKILDFGIAKLVAPQEGLTVAPTVEQGTAAGVVLGTIGYMSPEQVRGLPTDQRTDIFSLGAIIYEMLSGRRAFAGATSADTMSAILNADPPEIADPQRTVPPNLDRLIRRCLEKSPEERIQSARDLAFDLDSISTASQASGSVASVDARAARRRSSLAPVSIALAAGLLVGGTTTWLLAGRGRAAEGPARYRQLTFRRGTITGARFSPDRETIVYSAQWEAGRQELYTTHASTIGEQPLGFDGELLAVSSKGELAVLRDVRSVSNWIELGTLARAPLGGGAPRDLLRDVSGADWSSDGQELAITRFMSADRTWRLEYPVGTVVVTTPQWIDQPHISRDGTRVAYLEHPPSGDDRGRAMIVGRTGPPSALTADFASIKSIVWSPSGEEAWFSATDSGIQQHVFAVRPGSAPRQIAPMPVSVHVEDVSPDGRLLLQTGAVKVRTLVKTPADKEERDFGWLDYGLLRDMSPDGRLALFEEEGEGGGPSYSVFVRRTDGSPATRLGEGYGVRFSPDMQWVTTASPAEPSTVMTMVPIGPGEPRKLRIPLEHVRGFSEWFPDGARLAVAGNEPGRPARSYEYTIATGKIRPISPEGLLGAFVSPDSRELLARSTADGTWMVVPLDGSAPRPAPGLTRQDAIIRWAADSRSVYASALVSERQRTLEAVSLSDGSRRIVAAISPADTAGLRTLAPPIVSADGRTYAYVYIQVLSDLFVGDVR